MRSARFVKWFSKLGREDVETAGGKGANLGELTKSGVNVPNGFVVLSGAYFSFLDAHNLRSQIHKVLSVCNISDNVQLDEASKQIQRLIRKSAMPEEIAKEIFDYYHKLGAKLVAVRSSATAEDLSDASFAGQNDSFLNISGDANVVERVRDCWASLFGSRSIFYREQKKYDHFKVGIAAPVQKMIQSEVSGVMFTVDPISQDKDILVIEAVYGLGDYIVQGVVTPDHFEVDKKTHKLVNKQVSRQEVMEIRGDKEIKEVKVPKNKQASQKISDEMVLKIAAEGQKIHSHYLFPQDIEWAIENKQIYIVQARPITTLGQTNLKFEVGNLKLDVLLKGAPASPGVVSGPVRIVKDIKELDKVEKGDIMVTDMTTPDFVPAMRRAAGIITNRGGLTSHAAIVSRELGVPCVVGTTKATVTLLEGAIVTINGAAGEIYKGSVNSKSLNIPTDNSRELAEETEHMKTATKVYVNLAEVDLAEEIAKKHVDGVGLLRAEFMIAGIGIHPKKMIRDGHSQIFVDELAKGLLRFVKAFHPRNVIYRATDFKTNEYRHLKGGDLFEVEESNPMLGYRGAFRYISDPEVFELELAAIKKVRNEHRLNNLHLMIPFVRTPKELLEVKKIVATSGLERSGSFKLYMMAEIPSNVILLDEFLDVGVDGVSIGSNDLTMMIMGTDRDNSEVSSEFDERNPAVLWALEKIIRTCLKRGVACGICGQAPSEYPDLVQKLVSWGITSISVNPDVIDKTRKLVYESELRYVKNK